MRIYILEDDLSIIAVLEDIIESQQLGTVCGDSGGACPTIEAILATRPDIILLDFLMPLRDGVETTRALRAAGCTAKCIMISQVSSKEMIASAYAAGINFFISKPINVIEVRSVITNAASQLENERKLSDIGRMFGLAEPAAAPPLSNDRARVKRIQSILNQLGMSGEKGTGDILHICEYMLANGLHAGDVSLGALCEAIGGNAKSTEQRVRRAAAVGLRNLAHLGCEDFMNETFTRYSATLFPFEEVRREMDHLRGRRPTGGKTNLRSFLDGLLTQSEE